MSQQYRCFAPRADATRGNVATQDKENDGGQNNGTQGQARRATEQEQILKLFDITEKRKKHDDDGGYGPGSQDENDREHDIRTPRVRNVEPRLKWQPQLIDDSKTEPCNPANAAGTVQNRREKQQLQEAGVYNINGRRVPDRLDLKLYRYRDDIEDDTLNHDRPHSDSARLGPHDEGP